MVNFLEKLWIKNNINYLKDFPLRNFNTFGVGGNCKFILFPKDTKELKIILKLTKKEKIPFFLIGRGANLLISDKGFNGIVINLAGVFKKISFKGNFLYAGGGASLSRISILSIFKGLAGFENFLALPGTIGGTLIMNAGCYGKNVSDTLDFVEILNDGGKIIKKFKRELFFGYRESSLKKEGIIIKAKFCFKKAKREILIDKAMEVVLKRRENIPNGMSAGSIFKNPKDGKVKEILKMAGFENYRIGDALMPEKNPNVIINCGKAKAGDIFKLIQLAKEKVYRDFGIKLEEEVIYVGF